MTNITNLHAILELYRSRIQYFVTQGNRLWTRFHYFLTAELALLGVYLLKPDRFPEEHISLICSLGILWSVLWFVIGAQDLYFYEGYRKALFSLEEEMIRDRVSSAKTIKDYMQEVRRRPWRFKIPHVGVTTFASICPVLFVVLWGGLRFLTTN